MIEAMACGVPVIAIGRGSVPEVVVDGVTGFIVADLDTATAAVQRIHELDRVAAREHVPVQVRGRSTVAVGRPGVRGGTVIVPVVIYDVWFDL